MRQPFLVLYLVGFLLPEAEGFEALGTHERQRGNGALGGGKRYLVVDEGVVEAYGRCVGAGVCVVDALDAGPIDGAQAHGAGLARAVNFAATQVKCTLGSTSRTNGAHLGVGRGVVQDGYAVGAGGHNLAIAHDDSSKGAAAALDTLLRELDGHTHKLILAHN